MRLSCTLALLFVFSALNSALGECIRDLCIGKRHTCKTMGAPPHEQLVEKVKCEWTNGKRVIPGEHKSVCCDTAEEIDDYNRVTILKNQARSLIGASPNEYPHQIRFVTKGLCGGTIYNKEWIITAAHCVRHDNDIFAEDDGKYVDANGNAGQAYVIAGMSYVRNATDDDKFIIDRIIRHPDYKPHNIGNGSDIALLHLSRKLPLEMGKIQPMRLEPANYIPPYGGKGVTIGYGNVNEKLGQASDDLMEFVAPIHSNAKAVALSTDKLHGTGSGTTPKKEQLSIGGEDSQVTVGQGDSGGPFICPDENNKPILCGIASFKTCEVFKVCRRPSFFTRVAPFLKWIRKETKNAKQEAELFFDKIMFPDQIPEPEAPGYLVRIGGANRSCTGTLINSKVVITAAECIEANGGNKVFIPMVYHIKTGKGFEGGMGSFVIKEMLQRNISQNISLYMKQPFSKFDVGAIYLPEPIQAEYAQLPPKRYEFMGEADEYSFNDKTNFVERRHFIPAGEEDCARRFRGVDENLQVDFKEQLCMRQVYSAEAVCERDIGAPLMCEDGKYFCGIKSFHACRYTGMPEIFGKTSGKETSRLIRSFRDAKMG